MAFLYSSKRVNSIVQMAAICLITAMGISLFIEIAQYYIPGRTSQLMDLVANTLGAVIGIGYFLGSYNP